MLASRFSTHSLRLTRSRRRLRSYVRRHRLEALFATLAAAPVLFAFARALAHRWWPEGDDAVVALKVADVFSRHPPLMGMRSTSGLSVPALSAHHPGPLEFYLLAVPAALARFHPIGILVGTATLGFVTVFAIALVARRRGGLTLSLLMLAATLAVEWAVGSETLFRPLNPYPAVLPILLMLLLAWSLLADDLACMWGYALTASYVAQAHLGYGPLVAAVTGLLATVGLVRWYRRRRAVWPLPGWRSVEAPASTAHGLRALVVVSLCWLPVLIEMVIFAPSNLSLLLRYLREPGQQIGWRRAVSLVSSQLSPTPGGFSWLPGDLTGPLETAPAALAELIGVCLVGMLLVLARRPRSHLAQPGFWSQDAAVASRLALFALLATCYSVSRIPLLPATPRIYVIELWPTVVFAWAVLAWSLIGIARSRIRRGGSLSTAPTTRRKAAIAATVCLSTGAIVACASPVQVNWTDVDRARSVSGAVVEQAERICGPRVAVRVEGVGVVPAASLAPAISYRLRLRGHPIYYATSIWPYPQDDDFRSLDRAPAGSCRILVQAPGRLSDTGLPQDAGVPTLTVVGKPGEVFQVFVTRPSSL